MLISVVSTCMSILFVLGLGLGAAFWNYRGHEGPLGVGLSLLAGIAAGIVLVPIIPYIVIVALILTGICGVSWVVGKGMIWVCEEMDL